MQGNQARTLALSAVAVALLFVATAGARQQGGASTQSREATPPSPPVKVKAATSDKAAPAPMSHQHGTPATSKIPAQEVKGKYMTIVGEVMDPACYLEAGAKSIGPGHYQCAIDCAKSGQTLAIYARDQDLIYFIAGELPGKNPNDPLMAYIHKKVDVSGTVYHRSGAYGIVITKVVPHEDKPAGAEKAETPATGAPAGK